MFEELAKGFRAATRVEMLSWVEFETQEVVNVVERYGEKLWMMKTARIVFMEEAAIDFVRHEHFKEANRIVDQILATINWDAFFPIHIPEMVQTDKGFVDQIKRQGGYAWL